MPFAATHKLQTPYVPLSRIVQPQYVLKVDEILPSTLQDASPFTTTTPGSIPTLFIVNAFGIVYTCIATIGNHLRRSTVNINRLEVYIKIIYLIWIY